MANIKFLSTPAVPLEMHKVRIVQKLTLISPKERLKAIQNAGFNTFLLSNADVFLDMLTDSGVNAMSDNQLAAMMVADDSYAGSMTFTRLENKLKELFKMPFFLPVHQGRAAESILAMTFVKEGSVVPMNYHFTTAKAHITRMGGTVEEIVIDEGLKTTSDHPFKGNLDTEKLEKLIKSVGKDKIPFVRLEVGTNLIGGQPMSLENILSVSKVCQKHGIMTVMDASLLQDNLFFIKTREKSAQKLSIREITAKISQSMDIIYFSARKLGFSKGGGIILKDKGAYERMRTLIPLYEGFLTYGGMSVREMEALTVGLEETMDEDIISQGPQFIEHMVKRFVESGIPVVTPAGGLGCHLDAKAFLSHLDQKEYPAGALAAALYLVGGIRGMERGTLSEQRNPDGSEPLAHMELLRLAVPRRVFTLSQLDFVIDRVIWLFQHRTLVKGLTWEEEPEILRFFFGKLKPITNWPKALIDAFVKDAGTSL